MRGNTLFYWSHPWCVTPWHGRHGHDHDSDKMSQVAAMICESAHVTSLVSVADLTLIYYSKKNVVTLIFTAWIVSKYTQSRTLLVTVTISILLFWLYIWSLILVSSVTILFSIPPSFIYFYLYLLLCTDFPLSHYPCTRLRVSPSIPFLTSLLFTCCYDLAGFRGKAKSVVRFVQVFSLLVLGVPLFKVEDVLSETSKLFNCKV